MKVSLLSTAAVTSLLLGQYSAKPLLQVPRESSLNPAADILDSFLKLFGALIPEATNAWEIDHAPDMCKIFMQTKDGGNCRAWVTCDDGEKEYNPDGADWNVCYVGGRQYFTDPRIGDFSINFTQKDGEGAGLTNPILQLKDVGDWKEFPVSDLADAYSKDSDCQDHNGVLCGNGPYICHYGDYDIYSKRTKKYECGVPKIGKGGAGIDSEGPVNDRGYAPGWCGLHVTQYQKPDPSTDNYKLEVVLKDNNEDQIGTTNGQVGASVSLTSKLPYTVEIHTGGVDADPVSFSYADQSWDSNDSSRCKVGAYDSGNRDMDCGFAC